jgi:transcriptional regulator with XRE-family HTH domain
MRPQHKPAVAYDVTLMAEDMAARGWMQTDLARMAKVSDMTIYRWFNGTGRTPRTAHKIALALGYSVERYLLRKRKANAGRAA